MYDSSGKYRQSQGAKAMTTVESGQRRKLGADGDTVAVSPVVEQDHEFLTAKEAAKYLGVSVHKISRLIGSGELPIYANAFDRRKRLVLRDHLDQLGDLLLSGEDEVMLSGKDACSYCGAIGKLT